MGGVSLLESLVLQPEDVQLAIAGVSSLIF
jgi:hypothetical protein